MCVCVCVCVSVTCSAICYFICQAIRDSESGGGVAIDSLSMEEDCDGTRDSGIELRDREEGEGEGKGHTLSIYIYICYM